MENKLFAITPQYSSFVNDQVLTSHQLNEFIEYFKEQDHLTRVCLSGVGIVCGFDISIRSNEIEGGESEGSNILIEVGQGCAITTDGDLIKLQEERDGIFDKSTLDSKLLVKDSVEYAYYKDFNFENAKYDKFELDGDTMSLIELIPAAIGVEGEDNEISELDLSEMVAILYLENYVKEASICTGSNCDNQGEENVQNVKILLASKEEVLSILNAEDNVFNKHNVFQALSSLPETSVPKVVLNGNLGSGNNTQSYSDMASSYKSAITTAKLDLHQAFTDLFVNFGEVLAIDIDAQIEILNQIDTIDGFGSDDRIQYRYDLVRDISDSYNELLKLLLKLKTECCPNIDSFPKHLLLGCLEPSQQDYPELRHQWYPSPTNTEYKAYLSLARSLTKRIELAFSRFNLTNATTLEVTPSKSCGNLGEKAIPVYYDLNKRLLASWDFCKTENLKQEFNLSYHKDLLAAGSWVQKPLDVALDCHNFYRVEGHFGRPGLASRDRINAIRNEYGLDFDCLLFDLNIAEDTFTAFVKKHPSITHKAGVENGGTLILIAEDDTVVADYCLSYKVVADPNEQGCCSLIECTFPWISSLKYLNNLSRSILGTQSRNKPMPEDYILQVIEYRINGQRLINGTTTIQIPLQQIFRRRMHAVTEALNTRFDKGVVFDFNESQKRFVITRAKEDTYVLRFREVSMSNNNAIYTYSNNGMFRNNKTFRADAMRCRDLKEYNPSFYEKLHAEIAPVNKDDDYGSYDEKWRKWSLLTERLITNDILVENGYTRMITTTAQLQFALGQSLTKFPDGRSPATGLDTRNPDARTTDIGALPTELVVGRTIDIGLDPTIISRELREDIPVTGEIVTGHVSLGSRDAGSHRGSNFGSRRVIGLSLEAMKSDFQRVVSKQGTDLAFYVDGDWVNGTWVNDFMLDHYRRNKKNTHDDIVLFVDLRKSLHNETGFTKLSVYLENQEYIPEFDPVLTQYQTLIDVYFCSRPTGINAMRI